MRHRNHIVLNAFALGVLACSNDRPTSPRFAAAAVGVRSLGTQPASPLAIGAIDSIYLAITGSSPEFGGIAADPDDGIELMLTDTLRQSEVRATVLAALGQRFSARHAAKPWHRVSVKYSYATLAAWRNALMAPVLNAPGGVGIGIDHRRNLVRIGVAEDSTIGATRAKVAQLGIPEDAVLIEVQSQPRRLSGTLWDTYRPTRAGFFIGVYYTGGASGCTLGPVAQVGLSYYFLTAAHCTDDFGLNDHSTVAQTTNGPTIGFETGLKSPPGFFSTGHCDAGAPTFCVHSDVVVISYAIGVTNDLGTIARTINKNQFANGSLFLSSPDYTTIDNVEGHSGQGAAQTGYEIDKVGAISGWTYGYVQDPCYTYNVAGSDQRNVCFYNVNGASSNGDSGAPTFGPPTSFVGATLFGVLSTGTSASFQYSSMTAIFSDLSLSPSSWFFCAC
ncbi:MAG TPA: hypothetical protein VN706_19610 [Gemmatimonadaceae bacterium]|nr:hypothetical protein [Gemmatimonadaceae bacterium]